MTDESAVIRSASIGSAAFGDAEVIVSEGDDVQQAIDMAEGGGKLTLQPGTYQMPAGGFEIGSDITIVGETGDPDDVVLKGDSDNHNLDDTNYLNMKDYPEEDITIKNITIDSDFGVDDRDWSTTGLGKHLAVISADNALIENCKFLNGTRDCLDISQSVGVTIKDCLLEAAHTDDVLEINDKSEATGIESFDPRSDDILIEDCEIIGAGRGHVADDGAEGWENGIEIEDCAEDGTIIIRGCTIDESAGIDLDVQGEVDEDVRPDTVICENNDFKSGSEEYYDGGSFTGRIGGCVVFDDENTFKDDDIDNVLTGYRDNISAPNWGIDNCD